MNETIKDKINDYIKEKPKEQELYEIINKLLYNEDALKDYILTTQNKIKKLEDKNKKLKEENERLKISEEKDSGARVRYSRLNQKYERFKDLVGARYSYSFVAEFERDYEEGII